MNTPRIRRHDVADSPDARLRIMHAISPTQAVRKARRLIVGFILTDPRLAPVLLEIDLALSRANDDLTDN